MTEEEIERMIELGKAIAGKYPGKGLPPAETIWQRYMTDKGKDGHRGLVTIAAAWMRTKPAGGPVPCDTLFKALVRDEFSADKIKTMELLVAAGMAGKHAYWSPGREAYTPPVDLVGDIHTGGNEGARPAEPAQFMIGVELATPRYTETGERRAPELWDYPPGSWPSDRDPEDEAQCAQVRSKFLAEWYR